MTQPVKDKMPDRRKDRAEVVGLTSFLWVIVTQVSFINLWGPKARGLLRRCKDTEERKRRKILISFLRQGD